MNIRSQQINAGLISSFGLLCFILLSGCGLFDKSPSDRELATQVALHYQQQAAKDPSSLEMPSGRTTEDIISIFQRYNATRRIPADRFADWADLIRRQGEPQTPLEDPLVHSVLIDLQNRILDAAGDLGYDTDLSLFVASLPYRSFVAHVIPVGKTNTSVVLIGRDVFTLSLEMAKIGIRPFDVRSIDNSFDFNYSRDDLIEELLADTDTALPMFNVLLTFTGRGFHTTPLVEDSHNTLLVRLLDGIELFVVGHEYAHFALHHEGEERAVIFHSTQDNNGDTSSHVLVNSWHNELEADQVGYDLMMLAAAKRLNCGCVPKAASGCAELYFYLAALMDRVDVYFDTGVDPGLWPDADEQLAVQSLMSAGDFNSDKSNGSIRFDEFSATHPPWWLRMLEIRKHRINRGHLVDGEGDMAALMIDSLEVQWQHGKEEYRNAILLTELLTNNERKEYKAGILSREDAIYIVRNRRRKQLNSE